MNTDTYIRAISAIALSNKYTKWYIELISAAVNRLSDNQQKCAKQTLGTYVEGHHIMPRCLCESEYDKKDKSNIVYLTYREHIIAHMILCRMFEPKQQSKRKMQHACMQFFKVNNTHRKDQFKEFNKNQKLVAKLKEEFRKKQIEFMNSADNPHIGMKRSEQAKENMKNAWANFDKSKNHSIGKWIRTEETRKKLSAAKIGTCTGERNAMSKKENRDKVAASKIGRKRYYNHDKTECKYCLPGTEPYGFLQAELSILWTAGVELSIILLI